jgi:hypothetical protein
MSQDTTKNKPIDPEIVKPDAVHPDEVIHVPKGTSKTRFLMTFLLVVLVLTTFSVSSEVLDVFGGREGVTKDFMTWKSPAGVEKKISYKNFIETKRALAYIMPLVYIGSEREPTDEQTAAFIVLDESAAEAGIVITDAEMRKKIENDFKTSDNYLVTARNSASPRRSWNPSAARDARRPLPRSARAEPHDPDPKAIETNWKGRHQEFMYDYVELPVSALVEEARAMAPKGDELKAWFDALSEPEKAVYKTKPEVSAEIVGLSLEGTPAGDAILAKYPRPAGTDPEKEARDYHEGFGYARFPKAPTPQDRTFAQPYESVKAAALVEAPIYHALSDWAADLLKREAAGETIDLATEAAALGLAYRKQADTLTQELWRERYTGSFVGRRSLESLFDPARVVGKFFPAITVDDKAFTFGRPLEIKAEIVPEFSEIASRVESAWADKKAKELAVARLEKLRDSFGTRPDPADAAALPFKAEADEAKFTEVAKAAGFVVQRRDWRDRFTPPPPAGEEPAGRRVHPHESGPRDAARNDRDAGRAQPRRHDGRTWCASAACAIRTSRR